MKRPLKIITVIAGILILTLCCVCATAARCGPEKSYLGHLSMVEFTDEKQGAYFIKAEHEYGGYGWFTDIHGTKIQVYYKFDYNGDMQVLSVDEEESRSLCFSASSEYDDEAHTLTCSVESVSRAELGFEQLVFSIFSIEASSLRPYDMISASWNDENDVFILGNPPYVFNRTSSLKCYALTDEGYVEYKDLNLKWGDGSFKIFDKDELVAAGTYDFNAEEGELTFLFEEDSLFGDNKPFASYPAVTVKTEWQADVY